jgi:uncharacterized glyoxalase superfamily protein PhnB
MPLIRYRDLAEAMGWLEQAFGFEKQIAVSDNDGAVIYGQMTYRGSLMMMGAVRDTDLDKLMRQPDEVGGVETQSCYLVVEDADAHYARAREAGAEIMLDLKSDGLGRRGYSCRDPEGHIWNFGTYNPAGNGVAVTAAAPAPDAAEAPTPRRMPRLLMGLAGLLLALGAAGWWFQDTIRADLLSRMAVYQSDETEKAYAALVQVRAEKRKADEAAREATRALEAERARRAKLEANSGQTSDALAQEVSARRAAEAAVDTLREELKRQQRALEAAVEAKRISEEKLAVKSASAEPPQKVAAPVVQPSEAKPSPDASDIETSATRPDSAPERPEAAKSQARADNDDGTRRTTVSRRAKPARPARSTQAPAAVPANPKYPLYVTDVGQTWPYRDWSTR